MAGSTRTADVLVLKKTKLGESDLILTCLDSQGCKVQMVAKGARKPGNTFSSRLELYAFSHVLLVEGKSLPLVKEVRLLEGNGAIREDFERSLAAAPMLEVLLKMATEGGEDPRLFAMTQTAFATLRQLPEERVVLVTAAHLLKAFAFGGLTPSLSRCCLCGSPVTLQVGSLQRLSYHEGGVLCDACASRAEGVYLPAEVLAYADALLHARFAQLGEFTWHERTMTEVLSLCQGWSRAHLGASLKSLDFLLTVTVPAETAD